MGEGRSLPPP